MCIVKTPNIVAPPAQNAQPDTLHNSYLDSTAVNGGLSGRNSLVIRRQATAGAQGVGGGTGIQGGTTAPTIPAPPPIPGG